MYLYSTNNPALRVTFKDAVFQGLPPDNGLFMPLEIPQLPAGFMENLPGYSFQEIAFAVAQKLLHADIPDADLQTIIENAVTFPAPVVRLDEQTFILELFHGPSLAFKDFGARFMAQTMSYFNKNESRELVILVATSGDTGGAVAAGFLHTPGIKVVILYPSGKVSPLQEKQLTTLGANITALEVAGTFDDCQALVKRAFLDTDLRQAIRMSSANSINIARLIPQMFYYFESWKQLPKADYPTVFTVPSGNFGNLTAGLMARQMGLPVHRFIAATNANDVVPKYLESGEYTPRPSIPTISNAMDVGAPSNFVRMLDLYGSTWNTLRSWVSGYAFSDEQTKEAMREVDTRYRYVMDPHGAVGYLAFRRFQAEEPNTRSVILETAHPAKFLEEVESILGHTIEVPERLAVLRKKEKQSVSMPADFQVFKEWLATHY